MLQLDVRHQFEHSDFSLEVQSELPEQGVTAIFGQSGSGKTTLLRIIAGLEQSPGATVTLPDAAWQTRHNFVPTHKRALGYVFQEASLFPHLSAADNLRFAQRRSAQPVSEAFYQQVVDIFAIAPLLSQHPEQLSGGQRQRVAMARAVLRKPRLLLMDEPLASLDREAKLSILPYLKRLTDELELGIMYVSHDLQEIMRIAAHMLVLHQGRVLTAGPIDRVLASLPAASLTEPVAVLSGHVEEATPEWQLLRTRISPDATLWVPGSDLTPGTQVRVQIKAADVSLSLKEPTHTSILNRLPARVEKIVDSTDALTSHLATVHLSLGEQQLLCRLTRRSVAELGLHEDMAVWAQIKSVAIVS